MSAIFGLLRFDGAAADIGDLERMANTLAHRGPDRRRFGADGPVGLGHCLMRVNREDTFEAQPLRDAEADLTLVADCRIDNREALAEAFGLSPGELAETPDSALVLAAYKRWGEAAPEHLLGDFTFAVWDGRAGRLVLARDHMGQRPVFFHAGPDAFVFSSEIKGLWAVADTPRALDEATVGQLLAPIGDAIDPGATLYRGIVGLAGGAVMVIGRDGQRSTRHYWTPHGDPAHEGRDEAYYVETYRRVLEEAVACRLRRLVHPAALLLSAGFDSAAIAGLAGPVMAAQGRKLITVSAVVSEPHRGTKHDIRPWVEACRREMPHLDIHFTPEFDGSPLDDLERRFRLSDGIAGVVDNFNYPMMAKARAAGARLLLDGVGGDYTINPRGYGALAYLLRAGMLRRFFAELGPHMRLTGQRPWQVLKHELVANLLPRRLVRWIRHGRRAQIDDHAIDPTFFGRLRREGALRPTRAVEALPATSQRRTITHIATMISRQTQPNRAVPAAGFGLDFTRPMHDKRLVEFGLAVPEALYVKNGRNRYLACRALADIYPREYHTRGRANDGPTPDMVSMLDRALPRLMAECDRMERRPRLAALVDFPKLRRLLTLPGSPLAPATYRRRWFALRSLLVARHVEWFARDNIGE